MPDARLERTRQSLPNPYQFGDARYAFLEPVTWDPQTGQAIRWRLVGSRLLRWPFIHGLCGGIDVTEPPPVDDWAV